ncbi:MAG: hypothetical protein AAF557_00675 [Pseudomonadota bacterium]
MFARRTRIGGGRLIAVAIALMPLTVSAQDTENSAAAEGLVGEDIVIFGTKVESGFLETPTSVGVLTDQQIKDYVVKDTFEGFNLLANVRRLNTNGGNDSFKSAALVPTASPASPTPRPPLR